MKYAKGINTTWHLIFLFPNPSLISTLAYTRSLSILRFFSSPSSLPSYLIVKAHLYWELNFVSYNTSTGKNGIGHQRGIGGKPGTDGQWEREGAFQSWKRKGHTQGWEYTHLPTTSNHMFPFPIGPAASLMVQVTSHFPILLWLLLLFCSHCFYE